jgi:hypothetical protein
LAYDLKTYELRCQSEYGFISSVDVAFGSFTVSSGDKTRVIVGIGPITCTDDSGTQTYSSTAPENLDAFTDAKTSSADSSVESPQSDHGFTGVNLRSGKVLDGLQFVHAAPGKPTTFLGESGGGPKSLICPPSYVIVGLYGQTGNQDGTERVVTMGLRCRRASTAA